MTFKTSYQSIEETWPDQNRQWQWQWHLENTLKDQSSRLVTFETLITFMTIENNNLNIHSVPWIKSDRDSIRNSCDVFLYSCLRQFHAKTQNSANQATRLHTIEICFIPRLKKVQRTRLQKQSVGNRLEWGLRKRPSHQKSHSSKVEL